MRPLTLRRLLWTCGGLAVLLLACVVLALKLGAVPISVTDLVLDLGRIAIGRANELPTEYRLIVFDLRLPRILLGILVGAALSVSGASFQALLRNPLADPYVLGVSSGAALGSILALIIAPGFALITPLGAFLGAIATIAGVYFLGRREGQLDSTTLLLGGIISRVVFFRDHHVPDDHARRARPARHGLLADGRSLHAGVRRDAVDFHGGPRRGDRRDLQHVRGFEFAAYGRARSHRTWAWT